VLSVLVLSVLLALAANRMWMQPPPLVTLGARRQLSVSTRDSSHRFVPHLSAAVNPADGGRQWFRLPRSPLQAFRDYDPYRRQRVITGRDAHIQWWERARAAIALGIIVAVLGFALAVGLAAAVFVLLITLEAAVG
jgi:hypothetical protein